MKTNYLVIIVATMLTLLLNACSNKAREEQLQKRINELETMLDECQNGAEKLLSTIELSYENKDFETVKNKFKEIENRHPESSEYSKAKEIYDQVILIEENNRIEAERKVAAEKQEKLQALKKLVKKHDDISGITWYKQPYYTHYTNSNLISIYMGDDGTSQWLRLIMSYYGEDWIFFERAYISYEGNTKEIVFDEYDDKETENDGGYVWEWIDLSMNEDVENFLRDFAKSKDAKMRLTGKYTKTRSLTYNERQGIIDVLNGYDALKKGAN